MSMAEASSGWAARSCLSSTTSRDSARGGRAGRSGTAGLYNFTHVSSVLIIGSEALPFSKTGGLADVLGALPASLARLGWDVTLVVPRYRGVTAGSLVDRIPLTIGGYHAYAGLYEASLADGARAILVEVPELFDRDGLYGTGSSDYPDNPRRFATLVRAALEW